MKCIDVKNLLTDYIDNDLDINTKKEIKAHIAICEDCKNELSFLRLYKLDMSSLDKLQAPMNFLDNVHKRIEEPETLLNKIKKISILSRIKLPLEITATCFVIFTVIFIAKPYFKFDKQVYQAKNEVQEKDQTIYQDDTGFDPGEQALYVENETYDDSIEIARNDINLQSKEDTFETNEESIANYKTGRIESNDDSDTLAKESGSLLKDKESYTIAKNTYSAKKSPEKISLPLKSVLNDAKSNQLENEKYESDSLDSSIKHSSEMKLADNSYYNKSKSNRLYSAKRKSAPAPVASKSMLGQSTNRSKAKKATTSKSIKRSYIAKQDKSFKKSSKRTKKYKPASQSQKKATQKNSLVEIKKILKTVNGKIIKEELFKGTKKPNYIILQIPINKTKVFLDRLQKIVKINKYPTDKKNGKKYIRLKIKFVNK